MKNIQTLSAMDAQRMTSLDIAEVTGKPHNDVLKAIRKMESAWTQVTQGKFSLSAYQDATGRTLPCYSLSKIECLYIATKFNDEARASVKSVKVSKCQSAHGNCSRELLTYSTGAVLGEHTSTADGQQFNENAGIGRL